MIEVAIMGGSGYTGVELLRLLKAHPEVQVTCVTSRKHEGRKVWEVFPSLKGLYDLTFTNPSPSVLASAAHLVFTAVPHQAAMAVVPALLDQGVKVIDLSADFRISDPMVYEGWYQAHSCPELLEESVYGLCEIYRERIRKARLVANPGCYPTSAIIPLYPLVRAGVLDPETIVVDSKSGTSGAGRSASVATLFCEVNEGFKAYKVGSHRHTPEIEQELSKGAGKNVKINFTPHLVPMNRGILTTTYSAATGKTDLNGLRDILKEFYSGAGFVRILPPPILPNTAYVRGSNFCDIWIHLDRRTGRIITVSAIDNLVKGASGQAIQNMNIMYGLDEWMGLDNPALYP